MIDPEKPNQVMIACNCEKNARGTEDVIHDILFGEGLWISFIAM